MLLNYETAFSTETKDLEAVKVFLDYAICRYLISVVNVVRDGVSVYFRGIYDL